MSDTVSTSSVTFNIAEFHMEEVKRSLNWLENYSSRTMKISEIMDASNKAERTIMKLKELQSELAKQLETI
jgi:hypothetical protein